MLVTGSWKKDDTDTLLSRRVSTYHLGKNVNRHWPRFAHRTGFQKREKNYELKIFDCKIHTYKTLHTSCRISESFQLTSTFQCAKKQDAYSGLAAYTSLCVVCEAVQKWDRERFGMFVCTYWKYCGRWRRWKCIRGQKADRECRLAAERHLSWW
jgi:hypothetical protein